MVVPMKKFLMIIDFINTNIAKCISFILLPALFCIYYEVIARYFFVKPTLWASELTIYFCAMLYVLGSAWTLSVSRHVKIDIVYDKLSLRGKSFLDVITFPFFVLYITAMIWVGYKFALESILIRETSGTPWDPPIYPIKVIFLIGTVMLLLQGIGKFIRDLHSLLTGKNYEY
jgi:TRAP-type mannitol/chloroaromatic compound transport system permease small subunit